MNRPSVFPSEPSEITYLRLSITDRCDMRCNYCRPRGMPQSRVNSMLSVNDIRLLVSAFARNGITKVRLTGGEPLMRSDVVEIVRSIAQTPGIATVGLTTNGVRLAELAPDLARAGLHRVNISLDSLDRETFRRITGQDALDQSLRGLDAALQCGYEKVKINTVAMRGVNDSELPRIADLARQLPVEVRFIELMPLGHTTEQWKSMYIPTEEMRGILARGVTNRGNQQSAISNQQFISPMSEPFCRDCNRVRVTCSGKLKPCLRLPIEEDIRPMIGEPDLTERLGDVLRRLGHCKLTDLSTVSAVQSASMSLVGG